MVTLHANKMVAHTDAVAGGSTTYSSVTKTTKTKTKTYTRAEILHLRDFYTGSVPNEFDSFPAEIIRQRGHKESYNRPTGFLVNTRSLVNKLDNIKPRITGNHCLDSCVRILSETWMHENTSNSGVELADHNWYQGDCAPYSGKKRGGGVCVTDYKQSHSIPFSTDQTVLMGPAQYILCPF